MCARDQWMLLFNFLYFPNAWIQWIWEFLTEESNSFIFILPMELVTAKMTFACWRNNNMSFFSSCYKFLKIFSTIKVLFLGAKNSLVVLKFSSDAPCPANLIWFTAIGKLNFYFKISPLNPVTWMKNKDGYTPLHKAAENDISRKRGWTFSAAYEIDGFGGSAVHYSV